MSNIEKIKAEIERRMKTILGVEGLVTGVADNMRYQGYKSLLAFIDSLPDENNPEPYNPVYDEDYLNQKIAKAKKSWEGVDVNKMLSDCRGYEERPSEDLEEAANEYADKHGFRVPYDGSNNYYDDVDVKASKEGFLAGAEWMAKQGVTFTAAVDHYEDFYLDSCDQEAEAIKKTWSKSDGLGNSSNTKEMNEIKQTSLKEAAEEYAYRGIPDEIKQNVKPIADEIIKQFIAGAEWQKEQMMKEAVESEVVITSGGILLRDLRIEDFDYEDKVKIIIVKQDE